MKIFGFTPCYPPRSRVGSWLTTHVFLTALAQRGHTVTVMPWMQRREPDYEHDGITIVARSRQIVERVAAADVVVSHHGDNGLASRLAQQAGVTSVRMVHSVPHPTHRLTSRTALVVANSKATADQLRWSGPMIVCPPPTFPERHRTTPGAHVTLVNLSRDKGGELFWELARRMPDVRFLGVQGGYGVQIESELDNVVVLPTQDDMRTVWGLTRILLMPSKHESWGLTGVEAMCSGIPVIAHPTAGLRESLGGAGIFIDRHDPAGWERMLRRLLRPTGWDVASQLALGRVEQLDPHASVQRFCAAVERLAEDAA